MKKQNSKANITNTTYILIEAACIIREEADIVLVYAKRIPDHQQFNIYRVKKKSSKMFKQIFCCYFTNKR